MTRYLIASLLLIFAGLASSQSPPANCTQDCITDVAENIGCSSLDIACICSSNVGVNFFDACIELKCNTTEQSDAFTFFQSLCAANGIQVFQSSSSSSLATSLATSSVTSVTSMTTTSTVILSTEMSSVEVSSTAIRLPTTPSASFAAPVPSSSGLSSGAIVGVSVGAVLGALCFLDAFFMWRRRRNKVKKDLVYVDRSSPSGGTDKEVTDVTWKPVYEADGIPTSELEDRHGLRIARDREGRQELT
ncbi:hypothetical protein CC78DRAFT_579150 [Lojkania enalia]|uniref:CFEM domain-containing protein n=1 Tax=Lojkania enalia TaxID=147567 RepID=A0A9P4KD69_9PLEO|nr:hypothetical protein CC78DRAFT_579150 [Didymosphaeria enalia]